MEIVLGNCASARRITKPGGIAAAFLLCIASSRGRGSAACGPAGCPVPVPPSGAERLSGTLPEPSMPTASAGARQRGGAAGGRAGASHAAPRR
ncbi:unnamed protein product [Lepidochelys olivacea]